jgi:TPR repeat protein
MYEDGLGVSKDYTQAARWYRGAAEQGDPNGQYDTLYAAGRGVPLDYESAYVWYSLAASSGHARSASRLKSLSKIMTARQLERTQAKLADQEKPGEQSDKSQAGGLLRLPEDK